MSGLLSMLVPLETLPGWPPAPNPSLLHALGVIFGIIVGTMFVVAGIILAFRDVAALLLAVFGGVILAVCIWLIADSSDGGFPQESDYIVRYLARVLEAQPIEVLNPRPSASRTKY